MISKLYKSKIILFTVLMGQFFACREPFDPSLDTPAVNFLVVEGFINTKGVSVIQITRTQKFAEVGTVKKEEKAIVQIENDNNLVVGIAESAPGVYRSAALNLPADRNYRLRIKTSGGKEYLSEFTPVKVTPKLNLTWERSADGVRIYANSADPANQTLFYKYDFEETWSQRSSELSLAKAVQLPNGNMTVILRPDQDQIDALLCWTSALPDKILTTSTASLSKDVVDKFLVTFIPAGTERLAIRYSILVKQYGLNREAFGFFEEMKKTSELLGSVFDPLPSTIRGNMRCVNDPSEPVVGNIVAASAEEQRIFIEKEEVPDWGFALRCSPEYIIYSPAIFNITLKNEKFLFLRYDIDESKVPPVIRGFWVVDAPCLDCRKRNGHNVKPAFW